MLNRLDAIRAEPLLAADVRLTCTACDGLVALPDPECPDCGRKFTYADLHRACLRAIGEVLYLAGAADTTLGLDVDCWADQR